MEGRAPAGVPRPGARVRRFRRVLQAHVDQRQDRRSEIPGGRAIDGLLVYPRPRGTSWRCDVRRGDAAAATAYRDGGVAARRRREDAASSGRGGVAAAAREDAASRSTERNNSNARRYLNIGEGVYRTYLGVNILGACMSLGLWFLFTFEWCWFATEVDDDLSDEEASAPLVSDEPTKAVELPALTLEA